MRNMSLVYLVSQFEVMLQKFIQCSLEERPESLSSSRTLTVNELQKCREIGQAVQTVIEKEVTSVLQEDIDRIDHYLEQKRGIAISSFSEWRQFRERFYRRNVIVHNSAMINQTYRQKVGYSDKDIALDVDEQYLIESVTVFQQVAQRLALHFKKTQKRNKHDGN